MENFVISESISGFESLLQLFWARNGIFVPLGIDPIYSSQNWALLKVDYRPFLTKGRMVNRTGRYRSGMKMEICSEQPNRWFPKTWLVSITYYFVAFLLPSRDEFASLEVFKYFTIIASEDYYFLRFSKPEMSLTHTTSRSDLTVLTYGFIHFVIKRPFEILRNGHVETQILKYIKVER